MEELGDGVPDGADFPKSDLVLTPDEVILRTSKDHEASVRVGEAAPILGQHSLIFGGLLIMVPALALAGLAQHALEKLTVPELVLDRVAVISARLLQKLLKVVGVALSLACVIGRHDRVRVGTMLVLLLPSPLS
jgi:hypothetical protein